jgi:hypothetical protein
MTFDDWLHEKENYSLRIERLYDDIDVITGVANNAAEDFTNKVTIMSWLEAAYQAGYEQGKSE